MKPKLLTTLETYSVSQLRADVIAGITVAMVAMPLSIAIAIASGATPAQGLVTAIVGGFFISLLGGSRVQIGGPTAAFIVVVNGVIAAHGYEGMVLATMMAGAILIAAGLLRAGNLIAFVPEPVVNGFTVGIAVTIACGQLRDFLGLDVAVLPAEFVPKVAAMWAARDSLQWVPLGLGLTALALIIGLRRVFPRFPGLIVAVAAVSGLAIWSGYHVDSIGSRYGDLPRGLPALRLPHVTPARLVELLPSAMVIAFLAAVESLLSAMVADRLIEGRHRPNAEVMAQGWANIASALFAGLPATGAIARTATNARAGGRTPIAGIVHALTILIVMIVAAPLAGYLVMTALAAVLLITAWNMSEPHKWPEYWASSGSDRLLFLMTLSLTVLSSLSVAIGAGVALGLVLRWKEGRMNDTAWHTPDR